MAKYRDSEGNVYAVPHRRLRSYRVDPLLVERMLGSEPSADDLAVALAGRVAEGEGVRFLNDGQSLYAVPERVLRGYPCQPSVEALIREGERLLEGGLEPFDFDGHYPEEMQVREVRRINDYLRRNDAFQYLIEDGDRGQDGTYGETPVPAVYRILRKLGAGREHTFLDLGCGCGAAVLTAALLVGRSVGVDLAPSGLRYAREAREALGLLNTEFLEQDALQTDLSTADVVYVAATAFTLGLVERLREHLRGCRSGACIVSVTHSFESPDVVVEGVEDYVLSWIGEGRGTSYEFYFHRRV